MGQTTRSPGSAAAARPMALVLVAASAFALAFCLTMLFHGMRGVLDLGGFVAAGGPYEIEHPAPDWVWLIPVSILAGFAFGILNVGAAWRARGFNLLAPVWAGLFLALGWNFLEYGLRPPGGGGIAWGWIACGVVFWAMALPVIPAVFAGRAVRGRMRLGAAFTAGTENAERLRQSKRFRTGYLVLNLVCIAAGIVVATMAFRAIAG